MNSELPPNERPSEPSQPAASSSMSGAMFAGVALILVGAVFLLQNMGVDIPFPNFNWWALFILIPIFAIGRSAWITYQANGQQINREVRSKLVGAAFLSVVFLSLMYNINMGQLWPVFMIIGGLAMLFGGMGKQDT